MRCQGSIGSAAKKLGLAFALSVAAWGVCAQPPAEVGVAIPQVAWGALPPQAQATHRLILEGGPFPYPHKDGSVFGNREKLLPVQPRGYYREYTVKTPGSRDRGARRLVCGGMQMTKPDVCFYTSDHYASFQRVVQ